MIRRTCTYLAIGILVSSAGTASAVPVQDQGFDPTPWNFSSGFSGAFPKAQSFTVGLAGTLTSVDVFVDRSCTSGNMLLDIRPMVAGLPGDTPTALATASIPLISLSTTASFINFDISAAGLVVSPGDEFAIVMYTSESFSFGNWRGRTENLYVPGTAFTGNALNDPDTFESLGADWGFRTYVEAVAVPEPTTYVMGAIGLLALGLMSRRRKRD